MEGKELEEHSTLWDMGVGSAVGSSFAAVTGVALRAPSLLPISMAGGVVERS
eukprot:CAMPEP_0184329490 /NCGR_PEP_ID=MMETSP1049-20130417/144179_1 /TAXON_ID=77928 /ORGANISM="Proteomonas sulcata, Strain CCMP704" /LENGTH=51 /DNA_ID=CAMNT_0026651863 /DNA_START=1642 /DNA_END=1797 /DNA_ORIENTATION=-